MALGEYRHTLDPKNRLFLPAKYREEFGSDLVVSRSLRDKCLRVYPKTGWDQYIKPISDFDGKDKDPIVRALGRTAAEVSPDSQGRILLTPYLIKYAGLEKNAVIVGCGEYCEIWSEENFQTMLEEEDFDAMLKVFESYGM